MTNTASPTKTTERSISMAEPLWLGVRSTKGAAREEKVRANPRPEMKAAHSRNTVYSFLLLHLQQVYTSPGLLSHFSPPGKKLKFRSPVVLNTSLDVKFHSFPLRGLASRFNKKPPKHTKPNLNQTKSLSVFLSEFCSPSCHNPSKNKATQPIQKHGFPRSMKWMVLNRVSITLTHKYRKAVSLQAVSHVGAEESVVHALYCRQTQSPSCAMTRGKHIPTQRTWPR